MPRVKIGTQVEVIKDTETADFDRFMRTLMDTQPGVIIMKYLSAKDQEGSQMWFWGDGVTMRNKIRPAKFLRYAEQHGWVVKTNEDKATRKTFYRVEKMSLQHSMEITKVQPNQPAESATAGRLTLESIREQRIESEARAIATIINAQAEVISGQMLSPAQARLYGFLEAVGGVLNLDDVQMALVRMLETQFEAALEEEEAIRLRIQSISRAIEKVKKP